MVDLYDVISVDMDYFYQYGQDFTYIANHKRPPMKIGNTNESSEMAFVKGDAIHVPISITHAPRPKNWGTNLRTKQFGHYVRSMLSKEFLSSDMYPSFLNWNKNLRKKVSIYFQASMNQYQFQICNSSHMSKFFGSYFKNSNS